MALLSDTFAGMQVHLKPNMKINSQTFKDCKTIDSSSLTLLALSFHTGNPDNYLGEDCLTILINNGYWNDDNCEYDRGYICKRRGKTCCLNSCC